MRQITQSSKLAGVRYDVRGPILQEAERLECEGHRILKLNIGNPAPFGFEAPPEASGRHRALCAACQRLAASLVAHIYLENEILFARL